MTHNLEWRNVRTLFEDIGTVEEEHNGNLKVTVYGHAVVFHSPSSTDIATADQISQIRHLIKRSEEGITDGTGTHLLVVINHKDARIYQTELKDSVPQRVTPQDNLGHQGHVHSSHDYSDHIEKPNHKEFFEAITANLKDGVKILIFGSGEGSSSAMDMYVEWLKERHQDVSEKIIGAHIVDQSHLTEGQLLTKAREIYSR